LIYRLFFFFKIFFNFYKKKLFFIKKKLYLIRYCQGMADYLSPILVIMEDEVDSFWCFANLMEKLEGNFKENSESMENQLLKLSYLVRTLDFQLYSYFEDVEADNFYMCFRWILVQFKREFTFEEIKRLWEAFWTEYLGSDFHLFICYSILKENKDIFIKEKLFFDGILKHCINLSGKFDLKKLMTSAEKYFFEYSEKDVYFDKIKKKQ